MVQVVPQPGIKRSLADRLNAALAFLVTGSTEEAEKLCGIPGRTIRDWMKEESWEHLMNEAKKQKQTELDGKFTRIIHKAVDESFDRLENGDEVLDRQGNLVRRKVSAREATWIAAVIADKRSVLRGEPTSISKRQNSKDHLNDVRKELEKVGSEVDPEKNMDVGNQKLN